MKHTLTLTAAVGVLSLGTLGPAQAANDRNFSRLDRNQDSLVSISEAQVDDRVRVSFTKADINGDGFVSRAEFSSWQTGTGITSPGVIAPGPQNNPEIDSQPLR